MDQSRELGSSKEQSQEWKINPIRLYLEREHHGESARMLTYLLYEGNEAGCYTYRNKITRSCIVVSEYGELVSCGKDALHTLAVYKSLFPKRRYRRKETRSSG